VGSDLGHLAVGDAIFGLVPLDRDGAAAEYVVVPEESWVRRPEGVSSVAAAASALPALTASKALRDHADLRLDSVCWCAAGAVGSFVTQFAHRQGLSVTGTVQTVTAAARVRQLRADEVLVTDEGAPAGLMPFDGGSERGRCGYSRVAVPGGSPWRSTGHS
jgi:NADPH:quinone reductase-like Zn-dependent oxidoreductase